MSMLALPILALMLTVPPAPQPAPVKQPIATVDPAPVGLVVECVRARFPAGLDDARRDALVSVVTALRAGDQAVAMKLWSSFITDIAANGGAIDPNALVQYVLRASYLDTTKDLRDAADKVKYFNAQKKAIRDYMQKLRDYDAAMKDGMSKSKSKPKPLAPLQLTPTYSLYAAPTVRTAARELTLAEATTQLQMWKEELDRLDELSRDALSTLHEAMEQHQEMMQLLSSIMKQYHETAKAIIANMKA